MLITPYSNVLRSGGASRSVMRHTTTCRWPNWPEQMECQLGQVHWAPAGLSDGTPLPLLAHSVNFCTAAICPELGGTPEMTDGLQNGAYDSHQTSMTCHPKLLTTIELPETFTCRGVCATRTETIPVEPVWVIPAKGAVFECYSRSGPGVLADWPAC
jgi:hypothetical protein